MLYGGNIETNLPEEMGEIQDHLNQAFQVIDQVDFTLDDLRQIGASVWALMLELETLSRTKYKRAPQQLLHEAQVIAHNDLIEAVAETAVKDLINAIPGVEPAKENDGLD